VNKLVLSGVPFRDAYKQVGMDIEKGKYNPSTTVAHTHVGSIGNLSNSSIIEMMLRVLKTFPFEKIAEKEKALVE
jgi:argininosuccinate lyase